MSYTSEAEILSRHAQSLKEGRDACQWLARNADPEQAAPRGRHYRHLRTALQELEGTCRQMSMYRADARWTKLGIVYAKAMRIARKKMVKSDWLGFRELTKLFDIGLRHMEELSTAKTGIPGMILPKRPSDWLILPDEYRPQTAWAPPTRAMN